MAGSKGGRSARSMSLNNCFMYLAIMVAVAVGYSYGRVACHTSCATELSARASPMGMQDGQSCQSMTSAIVPFEVDDGLLLLSVASPCQALIGTNTTVQQHRTYSRGRRFSNEDASSIVGNETARCAA